MSVTPRMPTSPMSVDTKNPGSATLTDAIMHSAVIVPTGVIVLCSIVLWWALGSKEIQPWDEGFYAVRALAVVEKGVWLDQTPYALGGLYTSTYPPLTIWITALSLKLFGTTEFAVRFYPALCGTVAFVLMYAIARLSFPTRIAVLAPVLLAGTVVWNHYARLGMLDVPLVTWMLLALWATLRACATSERNLVGWCVVIAIAMAAGLMTKIVLSLIPLLFLVLVFRTRGNTTTSWMIAVAMVVGITVAIPWHVWMTQQHGFAFYKAFMLPHVTSTIEGSGRWLGPLFYVNQLLVSHPYSILAFSWLVALPRIDLWFRPTRLSQPLQSRITLSGLDIALVLWFVGGLLILSFSATKMLHYTVLLVPPMILLSLRGVEYFFEQNITRVSWLVGAGVLVACIWSSSQYLRDAVQTSLQTSLLPALTSVGLLFMLAALTILVCAITVPRQYLARNAPGLARVVMYAVPAAMLVSVAFTNVSFDKNAFRGAREVASWLQQMDTKHFYYVCHEYDPSDSLAPSLAWYTHGTYLGWREGYAMSYAPLPLDWTGPDPVVYLTSSSPDGSALFARSMMGRELVVSTNSYLIYK